METGLPILMLCFAGAILIYGALMISTGDIRLLPYNRRYAAKMTERRKYVRGVGCCVALTALCPLATGLVGLTGNYLLTGLTFVATLALCLWLSTVIIRKFN